jgi:hypothetical protein
MFKNANERKIWNRAARVSAIESVIYSAIFGAPALIVATVYAFTSWHLPRYALVIPGYAAVLACFFAALALANLAIVAATES